VDHHDDWAHWNPHEPDPHGGHDGLDPFRGHDGPDAFGEHGDHALDHDPGDPYLHGDLPGDDDLPGHDDVPPDLRHDADLADTSGHDPTDPAPSMMDAPGPAGAGVDIHLFGVDHDLPPGGTDTLDFPPQLDLPERPEPVDGYPWSDADTLGDPGTGAEGPGYAGPDAGQLLSYAGMDAPAAGEDLWAALLGSDDPAASALARWWGPASAG
jgi:hypothetical protein